MWPLIQNKTKLWNFGRVSLPKNTFLNFLSVHLTQSNKILSDIFNIYGLHKKYDNEMRRQKLTLTTHAINISTDQFDSVF